MQDDKRDLCFRGVGWASQLVDKDRLKTRNKERFHELPAELLSPFRLRDIRAL